ncbi:hypothetical protein FV226_25330 [Methylobacterium sp. WL12]|uniref:hypothetical protein n=1 Tax=Methylobacterium sp. WL12 TaxID=2603890 RepID=UPI0011CA1C4C|nr:hypothetical protein [Methylobacterium sp. WL12]TXM65241.1 hypothetical protein FV226_25330 [Methylobacterium sp. WL12]
MPKIKPTLSILPTDDADTRRSIQWLLDNHVPFVRHSRYHLKLDGLNYFLGKGTIFLDSEDQARPKRGFVALQELLISMGHVRSSAGVQPTSSLDEDRSHEIGL